jgi:hypothetical protein
MQFYNQLIYCLLQTHILHVFLSLFIDVLPDFM